ncbi:MAG TPA: FAD-binding oxidoreductase [Mycobacteriales bacterium]|nr:FAD-binding oxidoreductase [Mycobacteriales bacterium]
MTDIEQHLTGSMRSADPAGFQLLDPHQPQLAVTAADADDVVAAVRYAAERGLALAVQATGHGRTTGLRGGVLIATSEMTGVHIDPAERTAWVAAGATWRHVIEAAAPHGLAPLSGSSPGVGAVSYTLSGGIGLLARAYGFAADHVRRIELVTVDGQRRIVGAGSDPELFWAQRGGGGNFGVVTGIEIELVPLRELYGGGLFVEVERRPDVLARWAEWTETVPEEMTSAVSMLQYPDLPFVPEELRGRYVANLQIAYAGPAEPAERCLAPLRALDPFRDTLRTLPFTESGHVFAEPDHPHPYRSQNRLLRRLPAPELARLTEIAGPAAPVMSIVGIRHLGGALRREPAVANAVGHREAEYSLTVLSPVAPEQGETAERLHTKAVDLFAAHAFGPSLNFSYGPLPDAQIRAAFDPGVADRLAGLRNRLDPDRLIRVNHPL